MPRFSSSGAVAEGRVDWFDNTRTIFQDCTSGHCIIRLSDGTLIADHAANKVVGGGGKWAAWLDHIEGVFDFAGRNFPGSGLGPMGPNGEYALKLQHHSFGPWDVVEPDGSRWRLTDGDAKAIQLLGNRRAIWIEDGRLLANFPVELPSRPMWRARVANGLLYQDKATGQLVLNGHVIRPTGDYHFPDLRWDGDRWWVTYAPTEADVNAVTFAVTPAELDALPLIDDPVTPDPVPTTGVEMKAAPRKLWQFVDKAHTEAYPKASKAEYPGNCAIVVNHQTDPTMMARDLAAVAAEGWPMVVDATPDAWGGAFNPNLTIMYCAGTADIHELGAGVQRALALPHKVPVLAYLDSPVPEAWPAQRPNWITERVIPQAQVYREPGESIDAFRSRVFSMLERLASYGVPYLAIVTAFYDRNGRLSEAEILEQMPVIEEIIQEQFRWKVFVHCLFAWGRPGGITTYPSLKPYARGFLDAIPARPNRFDGWDSNDIDQQLRNKMGQSVELAMLSAKEKARVLHLLSGATPDPEDPPPSAYQPVSFAFDVQAELRALTVAHPVEWAEAYEYEGHPRTDRFVRLAAAALHAKDARIGLNGKRGTDVLSLDALAIKNPTVPLICGGVEIRDFIFDDGDPQHNPHHEIQWSDATILPGSAHDGQTFPDGVPGKWIQP